MNSGTLKKYLQDSATLKQCHIATMLQSAKKAHRLSFHTPGHKIGTEDITELAFSDNLSCPKGCILEAEREIAARLHAEKSSLLTDGSTAGVLSMLYAAKTLGAKTVFACEESHKSLFNGAKALGLELLLYPRFYRDGIPYEPSFEELVLSHGAFLERADAVFLTTPDYYGNISDLEGFGKHCKATGKLLLIDGAHGGHLHFERALHASSVADMWVDGVHKSLPAFTQGAVVSAADERTAEALRMGVDIFRTTSPSYPIMASVEYAVKYPRNEKLERAVKAYQAEEGRVYRNADWTKLCARLGKNAFLAEKELQAEGIYPEFCDGDTILFYLSPATKFSAWKKLKARLAKLFVKYPLEREEKERQSTPAPVVFEKNEGEWIALSQAAGRVCAGNCGLFPPCTPLVRAGDIITEEKLALLQSADNVFGLKEGKVLVYKEKKGE